VNSTNIIIYFYIFIFHYNKMEEKPNIFIDFDNTLIKGKFNESEIPERYDNEYIKKFVTEYYENEDYFMLVLNILQDLKLKYNLYVLSRNENKSLKDIIKNIYNIQTRLTTFIRGNKIIFRCIFIFRS